MPALHGWSTAEQHEQLRNMPGVPFFLKQMMIGGLLVKRPELDGRQWLQKPEV